MIRKPKSTAIHRISISVTTAQKRAIVRQARAFGLSASAYVRSKALDDLAEQVLALIATELASAAANACTSVDEALAISAEAQRSREERDRQIAAEVRASLVPEELDALHRLFDSQSDSTRL